MEEELNSKNKEQTDSTLELGGNINLTGFRDLDKSEMVIIKKVVGNHVKRFSGLNNDFEGISLVMKTVHETPGSKKYDLHAKIIIKGKPITSEVINRNLFVGIDNVLKKIEAELSHHQ